MTSEEGQAPDTDDGGIGGGGGAGGGGPGGRDGPTASSVLGKESFVTILSPLALRSANRAEHLRPLMRNNNGTESMFISFCLV